MSTSGLPSALSTPIPAIQEPVALAPAPPRTGPAGAMQVPAGMPTRPRAGRTSAAAHRRPQAAVPHAPTTAAAPLPGPQPGHGNTVQASHPSRMDEALRKANAAMPMAEAEAIANQSDFNKPLALAEQDFKRLQECIEKGNRAAQRFHIQGQETGDKTLLLSAEILDFQVALLNGLRHVRLRGTEWRGPVTNPANLASALPLFQYALALCQKHSDVATRPIAGLHIALGYLQKQVRESLQSLETGEWQRTAKGQRQARWHEARQAGNPHTPLPNPFAGLKAACGELGRILEQLRQDPAGRWPALATTDATAPQPAAGQPWQQRSFKAVVSAVLPASGGTDVTPAAPLPRPAARPAAQPSQPSPVAEGCAPRTAPHPPATQAAPRKTARRRPALRIPASSAPPIETRTRHPVLVESSAAPPSPLSPRPSSPPAPLQAEDAVLPSPTAVTPSGAVAMAAPPPVDPVAEAAPQRRQEQIVTLRAELAQLQAKAGRLGDNAQHGDLPGPLGGQPWDRACAEFAAWGAHDNRVRQLAARAHELFGQDSEDPAVRGLQRQIDEASRSVLTHAARAADDTLTAFSRTCHTVLTHGDPESAGMASYAELAAHCQELNRQWQEAPLRPRLPALDARMALYGAYKEICGVMENDPGSPEAALSQAEELKKAIDLSRCACAGAPKALDDRLKAFHNAFTSMRSDKLGEAVRQVNMAVHSTDVEQGTPLKPVLERGQEVSTAWGALIAGDPLPDVQAQAREPRPPANAAQEPPAMPEADLQLREQADRIAALVCAQHTRTTQTIELPADATEQAKQELHAGLTVLRQVELTARTASLAIACFHDLSGATPAERPALVTARAKTLADLVSDLRRTLRDQDNTAKQLRDPDLRDLLERSNARLRCELRQADTLQVSLETLAGLLGTRLSAHEILGEIKGHTLDSLFRRLDAIGKTQDTVAAKLKGRMESIERDLQNEKGTEPIQWEALQKLLEATEDNAWGAEKKRYDKSAFALENQVNCEKALIQGKLLLAHAAAAPQPESGDGLRPEEIPAFRQLRQRITDTTKKLAGINKALNAHTASLGHDDRYKAQLGVNQRVQRDLLTWLVALDKRLPPEAPTSSSQATPPAGTAPTGSTAQKDKPSRRPRAKHR